LRYVRRQRLASFEIVAHLDTGGMAEVYLARHEDGESLAVVKLLHEQLKSEESLVAMFREEGRIMTRLHHPNVVRVIGLGEDEGLPYMVLEYLAGDHLGTLKKVLRRQDESLPPSVLARIFLQVANGLTYVHAATDEQGRPLELVHRDISPQNIFLCYDGQIKLLDFGIALTANREIFTRTGLLKGKVRYMSPEQINSDVLDQRSDIFSLGVVMWEMSTGKKLFKASNEFRSMKMIVDESAPPIRSVRPEFPEELESIILTCLQKDPASRFQNAVSVRQSISEFLFGGMNAGRGDELPRIADQLLSERKARKEEFILSIRTENRLREFLFGDLEEEMEGSDSGVNRPKPGSDTYKPVTFSTQPETGPAPAPLVASDAVPANSAPGRAPTGTRTGIPVPVLGLLFALFLIGTFWVLFSGGEEVELDSPRQRATAEPEEIDSGTVDVDTEDDTIVQDEEPAGPEATNPEEPEPEKTAPPEDNPAPEIDEPEQSDRKPNEQVEGVPNRDVTRKIEFKNKGFLRFDSSPKVQVFLKGELLGKTPLVDVPLDPGWHELMLVLSESEPTKKFRVRIRKGEVTSHKLIY
jgi:serine/threonine protein kinase